MSDIRSDVSAVHYNMNKGWIRNNPELAIRKIEDFYAEAKTAGMMIRYFESELYVDIVAAHDEQYLNQRYA